VKFAVQATVAGSGARAGTLATAHGTFATPVFMPVGTRGTVRTQTLAQLTALAPPILLANTYHLGHRPGAEALTQLGGLHRWMGWPGAILTDSGGFQIFSLPGTVIDDTGATLRGADGRTQVLTPERSIAIQRAIGSDIMMVLDQCIASTAPRAHAEAAMQRTHRWAERSLAARAGSDAALFAIVQGACVPELRRQSADVLTSIAGFDGYAIGGLAVGESRAERQDITELVAALLPADRPRYLMGVGMPLDLLEAVHRGVDLFDCILPTALAQQGLAFTSHGRIDLVRGVHRLSERPLDAACACEACARPRSYLHHLMKCKEPLGWQLLAFHNLAFYLRLMAEIRAHLHAGTFLAFYAEQRDLLARADPDNPPGRKPRVKRRKARAHGVQPVPGGGSSDARASDEEAGAARPAPWTQPIDRGG
jgi:queuine tRNA-ribosyltransferase